MKKLCCITLFALISLGVNANDRDTKLKTLMEAQGVLEMFESQMEMEKVQNMKMGQQMLSEMFSQISPNEEFQVRFSNAYNSYLQKVQLPWGVEEIVKVWGQYYGKNFTDKELGQLTEFYTSPLGRKEVAAGKSALPEFSMHFQKLGEPIFTKAIQEYISEIKLLAEKCNCQK
jgi:hypothetical protein